MAIRQSGIVNGPDAISLHQDKRNNEIKLKNNIPYDNNGILTVKRKNETCILVAWQRWANEHASFIRRHFRHSYGFYYSYICREYHYYQLEL